MPVPCTSWIFSSSVMAATSWLARVSADAVVSPAGVVSLLPQPVISVAQAAATMHESIVCFILSP